MNLPSQAAPPTSLWSSAVRGGWTWVLLVIAGPVIFTLITDNIWEDFFITYRCSLNLVHGAGLTYEAGTRVHTFTSPLGALLPAAIAWGLRTDDPFVVLAVFRILGAAALGAAAWLAMPVMRNWVAALVATLFWALDVKIAAYSTNGMETALLVLAIVMAWRGLVERRPTFTGVAIGLAMWTRPDGFVFVGALALGTVLIPGGLRWGWRDIARAAMVGGVLYAPWFFWAWSYYGSPIPHTVVAKGTHLTALEAAKSIALYPYRLFFGRTALQDAALPPYFFLGEWPAWTPWLGKATVVIAAIVIFWRRCERGARIAAVAFVLGGAYLTVTTRAPWYYPGWSLLGYLALAGGVAATWSAGASSRLTRGAVLFTAGVLLLGQAWIFAAVTRQLKFQQEIVEWGVRAKIGLTLGKSAASSRETVFLEPLGYIGFFSGLSMHDTPGLSSPEVVKLRKQGTRSMAGLIAALQPDWAVLRASEFLAMTAEEQAALRQDYFLAATHDARQEVNAIGWLPGRWFLLFDSYYSIWRRKEKSHPASS